MRSNSSYFSTSQAAQMLGLSVGTVQRMVESGTLQAYTTQGGHRRILASSVRHYCQVKGVPGASTLSDSPHVCIIHHPGMSGALQQGLRQLPNVHLVSHPLELAGLGEEHTVFFVDAHVSWLDWPDLHRPQSLLPQARCIVYNSAALTPEQQQTLARHTSLHPGDISTDLLTGYLLGVQAQEPCPVGNPSHH